MSLNIQLSEHFKLSEFLHTNVTGGLQSNIEYLEENWALLLFNLHKLCAVLEQIRSFDEKPLVISSGFRSPFVNDKVAGSPNSRHKFGLAADFILHNNHRTEKFNLYLKDLLQKQIINYFYFNYKRNFCHIQI